MAQALRSGKRADAVVPFATVRISFQLYSLCVHRYVSCLFRDEFGAIFYRVFFCCRVRRSVRFLVLAARFFLAPCIPLLTGLSYRCTSTTCSPFSFTRPSRPSRPSRSYRTGPRRRSKATPRAGCVPPGGGGNTLEQQNTVITVGRTRNAACQLVCLTRLDVCMTSRKTYFIPAYIDTE